MNKFQFSLRTWLSCLTLAATLPVLLLAVSVLWEYKEFQQHSLLASLERRSDRFAQVLSAEVGQSVSFLHALAASDAAISLDVPVLYTVAKRAQKRQPELLAVALAERSSVVFLTSAPPEQTGWRVNAPELVAEALVTGQPNVSGIFQSPLNGNWVVAVTVPVLRNGPGSGTHVLRGIVAANTIQRWIEAAEWPADWIVGVVDRDGLVVARSLDPERHVGHKASESVLHAILTRQTGVFSGSSLEGTSTVIRVKPVFGDDWYLGIQVPEAVLNQPVTELLWRLGALAVVWVLLSLLMARGLSRYLHRQMQTVATAMARGEADLPANAHIRVDEWIELFKHFSALKKSESKAAGQLGTARAERDEIQDLYDHAPCGYHSFDAQGRVIRMNQTELDWLGLRMQDVLEKPYATFLTHESQLLLAKTFPVFLKQGHISDVEFDLVRKQGGTMPVVVSATALLDAHGRFVSSRSTVFDQTAQRKHEAELVRLATTDGLTGLSNRRDFISRAQQEIARCKRTGSIFQVLMLDIDFFKRINDTHGHAAGDEVLRELSRTIQATLRAQDSPARLGGQEFAVLVTESSWKDSLSLAERLREAVSRCTVVWEGVSISFTTSMGVAQWLVGEDLDATLSRADKALYQAKSTGRNRVCVFLPGEVPPTHHHSTESSPAAGTV